jgi:hypothetical protein
MGINTEVSEPLLVLLPPSSSLRITLYHEVYSDRQAQQQRRQTQVNAQKREKSHVAASPSLRHLKLTKASDFREHNS